MTGRELIIYILKHDLENKEVFTEIFQKIFITPETAALEWGCGTATVKALMDMNKVKGIRHESIYYILADQPNPLRKEGVA